MFEVLGSWKVHMSKKFPFSLLCNTFDPCAFDFSQIPHVKGSCLGWSFRFPGIIWWWLNKHSHAGRTGLVNTGHWCGSCQWFESGRLPEAWTVQAGGLFGLCPLRNSFHISQTHMLQWGHVAHLQVCCETTSKTCLYSPFHLLCLYTHYVRSIGTHAHPICSFTIKSKIVSLLIGSWNVSCKHLYSRKVFPVILEPDSI